MTPIQYVAQWLDVPFNQSVNEGDAKSRIDSNRELAHRVIREMAHIKGVPISALEMREDRSLNLIVAVNSAEIKGKTYVSLCLPQLYLIPAEEVPFAGPADPQLEDPQKIRRFKATCKFGSEISWIDRLFLRLYLTARQDETKAARSLQFILMHELGHVHHKHSEQKRQLLEKFSKPLYVFINFLTLGIFKTLSFLNHSRKCEQEADEFAFTHSKECAEGGLYLFETMKNFKPKGWMEKMSYHILCSALMLSHGSFTMRAHRIKRYLIGQNQLALAETA